MTHRDVRRVLTALSAPLAGLVATALISTAVPASADPLTDARAQAAALAATVAQLQTRAEVATEAYDAVESKLGLAVTEQMLAQRQVDADRSNAQQAADAADARVRALYESGGRVTLLATVLAGSDPVDAMSRLHVVGSLLSYDSAHVTATNDVVAGAARLEARLAAKARDVTRLQRAAASAAGRVRLLLATQRKALRAATRQVRVLVAQQQAAAAAADAAAFEQALASAGAISLRGQSTTPPNDIAATAIAAARTRLGDTYVWGGTGPDVFDCSGLTQWSYAHAGIQLPRVAADQYNAGRHIALANLEPGDLLFWATDLSDPATIHHVAMYVGDGMMIAAPHTGDVVKIEPVYMSGYIGATRPYS